ncbi:MAG: alpha-ketoglutarate-dependent dioxygenase AlkB [Acidobacteriota bacterium]|nr:alpha-ketoglutarate-dependent dioxygenase AlkB [Acidobacteriota bacterium]
MTGGLFETSLPLPEGLVYEPEALSFAEEQALLDSIRPLEFGEVRMHGIVARRRVIQLGWHYGFSRRALTPGREMPAFLLPIRERVGALTGTEPAAFSEALITEYAPGAAIGWHRDAPPFDVIVGVSLLSPCRFRFRRGPAGGRETRELVLAPRSIYVLDGPARTEWEHSIPPATELRYSITFRTLRPR